jgi:hypothetical protein
MLQPKDFVGVVRGVTPEGKEAIKRLQRRADAYPDGAWGPKTTAAFLNQLEAEEAPTDPGTPFSIAERRVPIVSFAEAHVGDMDPVWLWNAVGCPELARPEYRHTKSWCGGFALLCWKSTLPKCAGWVWNASGGSSGGFLGPHGVRIVSLPEPGDVAYWPTLNGETVHHYAIVRFVRDGFVYTVDGNVTRAPSERVELRDRSIVHTRPVFYSAGAYL